MAWSALIAEPTATMSALVMEDAEVLAILASPFRSLLEQDHDLAHSVLRRMLELITDRLRRSYAFLDTVM
jgi:CRP-like cAMP-binding protein